MHADERRALKRLGEEISKHEISWTVFNSHLLATDVVRDEEIADVDVFCIFCA